MCADYACEIVDLIQEFGNLQEFKKLVRDKIENKLRSIYQYIIDEKQYNKFLTYFHYWNFDIDELKNNFENIFSEWYEGCEEDEEDKEELESFKLEMLNEWLNEKGYELSDYLEFQLFPKCILENYTCEIEIEEIPGFSDEEN